MFFRWDCLLVIIMLIFSLECWEGVSMAIVPISHDREFESRAGLSELCRVIQLVICDQGLESSSTIYIIIFSHQKNAKLITFNWAATKHVMSLPHNPQCCHFDSCVRPDYLAPLNRPPKNISFFKPPLSSPFLPFERLELELGPTWKTKCSSVRLMVPVSSSSESVGVDARWVLQRLGLWLELLPLSLLVISASLRSQLTRFNSV